MTILCNFELHTSAVMHCWSRPRSRATSLGWLWLVAFGLGLSLTWGRLAVADDQVALDQSGSNSTSIGTDQKSKGQFAFVSVPRALVYSGPSEDFYPTDQLKQGAAVEVFHQTDSGWAAIRPPKGSFSWMPAAQAYLLPGGRVIETTSNNSVSWIGTALGTAKQYRWQVKLEKGEQLSVLGEEVVKDGDGREALWYKVAPPSGEFRWIQSGLLTSEPPASVVNTDESEKTSAVVPAGSSSAARGAVEPAANFQEEIIAQPVVDAGSGEVEYSEGDYSDGEYIEGEIYDEGYPTDEGEIVDGEMLDGQSAGQPDAHWNDWQLFEFTDEGLRFPLWERALARGAQAPDPLLQDPFSLAMIPKNRGAIMRPIPQTEPMPVAHNRRTPWRDPRMLSEKRMMGYPQASAEPGDGTTLSALQRSINRLGAGNLNNPQPNNYYSSPSYSPYSPSLSPGQSSPKLAPQLEASAGALPNYGGSVHGDFQAGGIQSGIAGGGSLSAGQPTDRTNWFGLGQRSNWGARPMIENAAGALMQLQHSLSEMVTRPMMQWNFGSLKQQVQHYIQNGNSPTERGQARLLLERIQSFEQLAMRSGYNLASHGNGASTTADGYSVTTAGYVAHSDQPPPAAISHVHTASTQATSAQVNGSLGGPSESGFDATGWLVPVHAAVQGQPTHAITDDSGQIIAYVTALPGMNLDRYINQAIGIQGLRGFLPQFQAAHIEAQNVVRLR